MIHVDAAAARQSITAALGAMNHIPRFILPQFGPGGAA
jgi:hypothetical protein